ncbi:hypothetical protein PROFUN_06178 [Planoprotostelium fungivorum]|uniref:Transmembrane protein n=1 Tax=Planoprotostelium fungivorum TaxID=1890364 RepID=A0A2P6MYX2_9EUKA|nr:hypothetical protein PROFUN_06178 [Planoprotostelium fungivorum]
MSYVPVNTDMEPEEDLVITPAASESNSPPVRRAQQQQSNSVINNIDGEVLLKKVIWSMAKPVAFAYGVGTGLSMFFAMIGVISAADDRNHAFFTNLMIFLPLLPILILSVTLIILWLNRRATFIEPLNAIRSNTLASWSCGDSREWRCYGRRQWQLSIKSKWFWLTGLMSLPAGITLFILDGVLGHDFTVEGFASCMITTTIFALYWMSFYATYVTIVWTGRPDPYVHTFLRGTKDIYWCGRVNSSNVLSTTRRTVEHLGTKFQVLVVQYSSTNWEIYMPPGAKFEMQ